MTNINCVSRRNALGTVAACLGLSGCLSEGESTPEPVRITGTNETDNRYEMQVSLEFQGTTLLDESFTLYPSGKVNTSFENPTDAGEGVLLVSIDDGEPDRTTIRMGAGTGLEDINITVNQGGGVSVGIGRV